MFEKLMISRTARMASSNDFEAIYNGLREKTHLLAFCPTNNLAWKYKKGQRCCHWPFSYLVRDPFGLWKERADDRKRLIVVIIFGCGNYDCCNTSRHQPERRVPPPETTAATAAIATAAIAEVVIGRS